MRKQRPRKVQSPAQDHRLGSGRARTFFFSFSLQLFTEQVPEGGLVRQTKVHGLTGPLRIFFASTLSPAGTAVGQEPPLRRRHDDHLAAMRADGPGEAAELPDEGPGAACRAALRAQG